MNEILIAARLAAIIAAFSLASVPDASIVSALSAVDTTLQYQKPGITTGLADDELQTINDRK